MPSLPPRTRAVTGALRAIEELLLRGEQRTARRNAWNAVLEDRRRARARRDVERVTEGRNPGTAQPT